MSDAARTKITYATLRADNEELHAAFDRYLVDVPGIDFGRFDVRAPSRESVAAGQGIRVLEFNGVTGEATHVYQPGYPWWKGIRDRARRA